MHHDLIYENYEQLVSSVFHYQNQQNDIRIFCLKIIIGTLGIISLLTLSNLNLSRVTFSIIASITPFLALLAVTSGLISDLFYKEQLKMGFFFEAIKLEQEHGWIPEFHNCLIIEESKKGYYAPAKEQIYFYRRCVAILIFLSSAYALRIPFFSSFLAAGIVIPVFGSIYFIYISILDAALKRTYSKFSLKEKKIHRVVSDEIEHLISSLHSKGKELTQSLSDTTMKYKNLTFAIITAIFMSAAYVAGLEQTLLPYSEDALSAQIKYINHHKMEVISVLTFFAIICLNFIRYLDVNICHAQMKNLYKALKKIEEAYPNLAQPYAFFSKSLYRKKMAPSIIDAMFYTSFNLVIITFGAIMTFSQSLPYRKPTMIFSICVFSVLVLSEIISLLLTYRISRQKDIVG